MSKKRKPYLSPVPAGDNRLNSVDVPFNADTVERVVDNPFSSVGGKVVVTVSTRDDPFELMRARRQLDDCQYMVGLKIRDWFECAQLGDLRGIEYKVKVDGAGAMVEPRTDAQKRARDKLDAGRATTGRHGWGLICTVLRDKVSLSEFGESHGIEPRFLFRMFGTALDDLAELYGYSTKANRRAKAA